VDSSRGLRARARQLFDFEYRIEVYTPKEKRPFGYFTMPILHRDRLVGRIDAKAHRKDGRFEVRALQLEDGVGLSDSLIAGIARAVRECAVWHRTPEADLTSLSPSTLVREVLRALSA
jgi:uncharacterized protein YcaQ